ncbi:short-chain dehydrogenase, putative [Pediculus humanus corporis]|uniref:Short-chain dehydrogenase, putative n=1 Tax=Pediculus humanus subsp. corporis TaxID=121224 RepID=E0VQE4_PEDHC|nr:short-chain dehydrogenase, putative [Pediculus humanus corporis]EEB15600.1 short-chain dehydrogenase, putative [Pediculus humanus corporis]
MSKLKENITDIVVFLCYAVYYILDAIIHYFLPFKLTKKNISKDIVLVTGGGGGLGRLLAEKFSELGCTIIVWDINAEGNETVTKVKSLGGNAHGYTCDITNREMVYETAKKVEKQVGKVTILVNNAGIVSGRPLLETPDSLIQKTFDVNVISHFWTTKAFLPGMIDLKRGHIVTIASMAGTVGMTKLVDYCSSKFAAVGFDESLRVELESHGHLNIHTTAVCPYFIKSTGMFDGVDTRLVPILDASYVAEKVVKAVITNQKQVFLPWFFKFLICIKGIVPWVVVSMALKTLVHDAHPDHLFNHPKTGLVKTLSGYDEKNSSILETAKNIEHEYRDSSIIERKP